MAAATSTFIIHAEVARAPACTGLPMEKSTFNPLAIVGRARRASHNSDKEHGQVPLFAGHDFACLGADYHKPRM